MPGVKTLADGRRKWAIMSVKPADLKAIKLAELTAGQNVGDRATAAGTYLRATASDTIDDRAFNAVVNSSALGTSNFDGQIEPYLFLDATTGVPDDTDNALHDQLDTKGTTLWIAQRKGPLEGVEWAASDAYRVFEVTTDEPQEPSEQSGYMRAIIPLIVRDYSDGTVAST